MLDLELKLGTKENYSWDLWFRQWTKQHIYVEFRTFFGESRTKNEKECKTSQRNSPRDPPFYWWASAWPITGCQNASENLFFQLDCRISIEFFGCKSSQDTRWLQLNEIWNISWIEKMNQKEHKIGPKWTSNEQIMN